MKYLKVCCPKCKHRDVHKIRKGSAWGRRHNCRFCYCYFTLKGRLSDSIIKMLTRQEYIKYKKKKDKEVMSFL